MSCLTCFLSLVVYSGFGTALPMLEFFPCFGCDIVRSLAYAFTYFSVPSANHGFR